MIMWNMQMFLIINLFKCWWLWNLCAQWFSCLWVKISQIKLWWLWRCLVTCNLTWQIVSHYKLYISPSKSKYNFSWAILGKNHKMIQSKSKYTIKGDFNIDYDKHNLSSYTRTIQQYFNIITSVECEQLIKVPTRIISTHKSIIDNIYVNKQLCEIWNASVLQHGISDHLPTF